jgi:hypothetical protein
MEILWSRRAVPRCSQQQQKIGSNAKANANANTDERRVRGVSGFPTPRGRLQSNGHSYGPPTGKPRIYCATTCREREGLLLAIEGTATAVSGTRSSLGDSHRDGFFPERSFSNGFIRFPLIPWRALKFRNYHRSDRMDHGRLFSAVCFSILVSVGCVLCVFRRSACADDIFD